MTHWAVMYLPWLAEIINRTQMHIHTQTHSFAGLPRGVQWILGGAKGQKCGDIWDLCWASEHGGQDYDGVEPSLQGKGLYLKVFFFNYHSLFFYSLSLTLSLSLSPYTCSCFLIPPMFFATTSTSRGWSTSGYLAVRTPQTPPSTRSTLRSRSTSMEWPSRVSSAWSQTRACSTLGPSIPAL